MEKILWTKDLERFNTGGKIYEVGAHDSQVTPQGTIFSYFNDMRNRDDKILCAPEGPPVSSLVEFDPTTNEILWQHSHPGFSAETLGSCERQKNGNILYSEANAGKAYVTTPEGKVVWKFVNPELSGKGEPQPFGKIRAQSVKFLKARGLVE